jgi:hypothetical protein
VQGRVEVEWPVELRSKGLWLLALLNRGRSEQPGNWHRPASVVLISPEGKVVEIPFTTSGVNIAFRSLNDAIKNVRVSFDVPEKAFDPEGFPPKGVWDVAVLRPVSETSAEPATGEGTVDAETHPMHFVRVSQPVRIRKSFKSTPGEMNVWSIPIEGPLASEVALKLKDMDEPSPESQPDAKDSGDSP